MGVDAQSIPLTTSATKTGSFKDFSITMLNFLRDDVPGNWRIYCDEVTDNFRVVSQKIPDYRVSGVYLDAIRMHIC